MEMGTGTPTIRARGRPLPATRSDPAGRRLGWSALVQSEAGSGRPCGQNGRERPAGTLCLRCRSEPKLPSMAYWFSHDGALSWRREMAKQPDQLGARPVPKRPGGSLRRPLLQTHSAQQRRRAGPHERAPFRSHMHRPCPVNLLLRANRQQLRNPSISGVCDWMTLRNKL